MKNLNFFVNDIMDIYKIAIFVFIGIIGILTIILICLYRNKKGLFGNKQDNNINNIYKEDIIEIEEFETEPKTKEELAEEAYKEHEEGKITEAELNNRLRRIWWSEDD